MHRYTRSKGKGIGEEMSSKEEGEIKTVYATVPLLRVGEAAKYLGVSRKTLYRIIEMGEITAVKAEGTTLVERKSLDEFRAAGIMT